MKANMHMSLPASRPFALRLLVISTLAALLGACAVGPDYHRPEVATTSAFKEIGDWKPASPADTAPRGEWWKAFGDPVLNQLMEDAARANQNIKLAEANYRQAQALLQSARAGFWPTAGVSLNSTRGHALGAETDKTTDALQLQASWAPDLWGKVRRSVESGNASTEASESTLAAIRLSTGAQVAQSYFNLRVNERQQALLSDSVREYQRALTLTENQLKAGTVTRIDVLQAQTQLNSARAQLADVQLSGSQLKHALAVLCGQSPSSFELAAGQVPSLRIEPVPPVPSELLQRRPDIAAAERKLAALNAQIGVAKAAWFPSLTLNAAYGYQSSGFTDLISAPNRLWSLGPQLAQALFDGGARAAQTEAARASYDAGVAQYRQTVLAAFQEVEDNIAAVRKLGEEIQLQQAAVDAARQSAAVALNQYKAGTVSYLNVVSTQTAQLNAERTLWQLIGRELTARVVLVTALGGMWG